MKFFIMIALPIFYIVSGILSLNGIYIVKNAKEDAHFLIGLGTLALIYIIYILYKKKNKNELIKKKNDNKYSYAKIGILALIVIPYFILRELGIYFTDDTSLMIVLIIIFIMSLYQIKNKKIN